MDRIQSFCIKDVPDELSDSGDEYQDAASVAGSQSSYASAQPWGTRRSSVGGVPGHTQTLSQEELPDLVVEDDLKATRLNPPPALEENEEQLAKRQKNDPGLSAVAEESVLPTLEENAVGVEDGILTTSVSTDVPATEEVWAEAAPVLATPRADAVEDVDDTADDNVRVSLASPDGERVQLSLFTRASTETVPAVLPVFSALPSAAPDNAPDSPDTPALDSTGAASSKDQGKFKSQSMSKSMMKFFSFKGLFKADKSKSMSRADAYKSDLVDAIAQNQSQFQVNTLLASNVVYDGAEAGTSASPAAALSPPVSARVRDTLSPISSPGGLTAALAMHTAIDEAEGSGVQTPSLVASASPVKLPGSSASSAAGSTSLFRLPAATLAAATGTVAAIAATTNTAASGAANAVSSATSTATDAAAAAADATTGVAAAATDAASGSLAAATVASSATDTTIGAVAATAGTVTGVVDATSGAVTAVTDASTGAVTSVNDTATDAVAAATNAANTAAAASADAATGAWSAATGAVTGMDSFAAETTTGTAISAADATSGNVSAATDITTGAFSAAAGAVTSTSAAATDATTGAVTGVASAVTDAATDVTSAVTDVTGRAFTAVTSAADGTVSATTGAVGTATDASTGVVTTVTSSATSTVSAVTGAAASAVTVAKEATTDAIAVATTAATGAVAPVTGAGTAGTQKVSIDSLTPLAAFVPSSSTTAPSPPTIDNAAVAAVQTMTGVVRKLVPGYAASVEATGADSATSREVVVDGLAAPELCASPVLPGTAISPSLALLAAAMPPVDSLETSMPEPEACLSPTDLPTAAAVEQQLDLGLHEPVASVLEVVVPNSINPTDISSTSIALPAAADVQAPAVILSESTAPAPAPAADNLGAAATQAVSALTALAGAAVVAVPGLTGSAVATPAATTVEDQLAGPVSDSEDKALAMSSSVASELDGGSRKRKADVERFPEDEGRWAPDAPATKVTTVAADGTTAVTTVAADGVTTVTAVAADGSTAITTMAADGTTAITTAGQSATIAADGVLTSVRGAAAAVVHDSAAATNAAVNDAATSVTSAIKAAVPGLTNLLKSPSTAVPAGTIANAAAAPLANATEAAEPIASTAENGKEPFVHVQVINSPGFDHGAPNKGADTTPAKSNGVVVAPIQLDKPEAVPVTSAAVAAPAPTAAALVPELALPRAAKNPFCGCFAPQVKG